jgi:TupA-like ATPgrasp
MLGTSGNSDIGVKMSPGPGSPEDFPESWDLAAKVRWRMLHDRNPLHPLLLDKVAVKGFAEKRGVLSARTIHVTRNPRDIPFGSLPESCFLKANHASAWNYLRHGGVWYFFGYGTKLLQADGGLVPEPERARFRLSEERLRAHCAKMLSTTYSVHEWAYHQITPQLVIEERLVPKGGGELMDFRIFTFDGHARAISVGSPSYRRGEMNIFLTPDWEIIPLSSYSEALPERIPERPPLLSEMLEAASRLGKGIDFARIDLYQTRDGIRLGEITLYPEGGYLDTPTSCPRFNRWLGSFWPRPFLGKGESPSG